MTQIPIVTTKNTYLIYVNNRWYARYWIDGKEKRKSLGTPHLDVALVERDKFYASLPGAKLKTRRTREQKLADNDDLYILRREPWYCVIKGVMVGSGKTKAEVKILRNKYLEKP